MSAEPELHYFCKPTDVRPVRLPVEFLPVAGVPRRRAGVQAVWDLVATSSAPAASSSRSGRACGSSPSTATPTGGVDGFLLVNAPVNWQIDYVVVRPERRGQGIASAPGPRPPQPGVPARASVRHADQQGVPAAALRVVRVRGGAQPLPGLSPMPVPSQDGRSPRLPARTESPPSSASSRFARCVTIDRPFQREVGTMCGIVGFTGRREAAPILLEGLRRLEYRGYDSAGHGHRHRARRCTCGRRPGGSPSWPRHVGDAPGPGHATASATPAGPPTAAPPTATPTRTSTPPATSPSSTTA